MAAEEWSRRLAKHKRKTHEMSWPQWIRLMSGIGQTKERMAWLLARTHDPTSEIHLYHYRDAENFRGAKFKPGEGVGSPEFNLAVLRDVLGFLDELDATGQISGEEHKAVLHAAGAIARIPVTEIRLPQMEASLNEITTGQEVMTALYRIGKYLRKERLDLHLKMIEWFDQNSARGR